MLNKLGIYLAILILSACTVVRVDDTMRHSAIDKQLDLSLINKHQATVIVYHHQGHGDEFPIYIDKNMPMGTATAKTPLRFAVSPGLHSIHAGGKMAVDRVIKQSFEAGKIYYFKIEIDQGMWVSSIRLTQTQSIADF